MAGNPFESGKTIVIKSMDESGSRRYIDTWPAYDTRSNAVYLIESMDYSAHAGSHFQVEKLGGGLYRFISQSTSSNRRYIDTWPASPNRGDSVYLDPASSGAGSRFLPRLLADGSYTLQCQSTSSNKRYLHGNPNYGDRGDGVYLTDDSASVGSHWKVGVDYFTGQEVENIIHGIYPGIGISYYKSDPRFGTLDYNLLKGIWDRSGLGSYQWKEHKFDCDDFAVIMKGEVAKYSYNQSKPDDKGSLCGILWGRNAQGHHAYNFTIDPFGELILFEPRNGQIIANNTYTPYFCLM